MQERHQGRAPDPGPDGVAGTRPLASAAAGLAVVLPLLAAYWTIAVVETRVYRTLFLLIALVLGLLLHPARRRSAARVTRVDLVLVALTVAALGWPLVSPGFGHRAAEPLAADLWLGGLAVLLVLEVTRRSAGWVLPLAAALFLVYAFAGPWLDRVGLDALAHRGYGPARLAGTLYIGLDGLFGVPLDVASTYIALFALYGAVLEASGATRFFITWAEAALAGRGGRSGPARTVTAAGFLLGTVSGSGVATTVTLGGAAWPLLRRAGYPAETAGALLAAAGIGALLSPPTLGAAAFLIAEFLKVAYLDLLVMVTVPTVLYYLAVLLMAEADARRLGLGASPRDATTRSLWAVTRSGPQHLLALVAVAALMAAGVSPFRAVLWSVALALATQALTLGGAAGWRTSASALGRACREAGTSLVPVTATTACAGLIVGVSVLTGLGLKAAGLIVAAAGGSRPVTILLAALAVWLVGLAVPVTASYVLAAVTVAPALTQVGVPEVAAHLFIFYYAVLSEVSPPTALAPLAAATLTGGDPLRTVLRTWRYTLPAFLVPLAFTLDAQGLGLLLQAPAGAIVLATLRCVAGIAALAAGLGGWMGVPARPVERGVCTLGGLLLFVGGGWVAAAGLALAALAALLARWNAARPALDGPRLNSEDPGRPNR